MYEFVNRADIEVRFVFHKKHPDKTYRCDFRPANSLVCYLSGGHTFYYSGKRIEGRVGDIVIIPYGATYSNELLSDDTQYFQIDFCIYENGKAKAIADEITVIKNRLGESVTALFKDAFESYIENEQVGRLLCISETLKILAILKRSSDFFGKKDTAEEIFFFIKENCTTNITARDIAKKFNISISLLEKKLKARYDMSPVRLKNYLRIEASKQLLAEGYNIDEVSSRTGFCDRYHFTKTFTSFVGQSPSRFTLNLKV